MRQDLSTILWDSAPEAIAPHPQFANPFSISQNGYPPTHSTPSESLVRTYAVATNFMDCWVIFCELRPQKITQLRQSSRNGLGVRGLNLRPEHRMSGCISRKQMLHS